MRRRGPAATHQLRELNKSVALEQSVAPEQQPGLPLDSMKDNALMQHNMWNQTNMLVVVECAVLVNSSDSLDPKH